MSCSNFTRKRSPRLTTGSGISDRCESFGLPNQKIDLEWIAAVTIGTMTQGEARIARIGMERAQRVQLSPALPGEDGGLFEGGPGDGRGGGGAYGAVSFVWAG
jgi:hypothetical protein